MSKVKDYYLANMQDDNDAWWETCKKLWETQKDSQTIYEALLEPEVSYTRKCECGGQAVNEPHFKWCIMYEGGDR